MAKKPQYPNPKFFKAKDNIDWKKQGENLMTCMKIFAEMFKETDWNRFFEGQKNNAIAFADRVKEEYAAFMALDAAFAAAGHALHIFKAARAVFHGADDISVSNPRAIARHLVQIHDNLA